MAERHFDLYVEPVSNSIHFIVIYGVNTHAKFGGKFVRSNKMAPVHVRTEMSRTGALQADKKETSKDKAAAAYFALAIC